MHDIEEFANRNYLNKIAEVEVGMLEFLNFNFDFINLYQSALAVKLLIAKENIIKSIQRDYTRLRLNKVLCIVDLTNNLMEAVPAAFDEEDLSDLKINFNRDSIVNIRKFRRM